MASPQRRVLASAPVSGREKGISGALRVIPGGRGNPERITHRVTEALAPCIEGIAVCDEVLSAVDRIVMAAAAGSRQAVVNEAGRLAYRAQQARAELRAMAGEIDHGNAA